ncbi:HAD-IIA family hydrolase [Alkalihalobacillus pseudalcaliphilus]|uniref:HAD-IIA family hydrolase n=1 Tax=Alkalihalobacillus pseudalcaliphilus TaxID=79884 RepID=UPI00064D9802|nr:HAD-IIA family hydrolase [Alkalihalobacillus pseudalcaliphilus]KMK77380.1 HAD family hydrolase [Alkalihalobacillus pseudalcaliphilus]
MEKGFIFDLDGTVYLGEKEIDGAADAINQLRARGDRVLFLSNKPIATRQSYVEKLNKMGITTNLDEVLNSNLIMAQYLRDVLNQDEKALVIGEPPLIEELALCGVSTTKQVDEAQYVVLSWDRQFSYEKLNDAYQAWKHGAKIIATNPDRTCPIEGGDIPDCGAMIGALEGATGKPIDLVVGKPSALMAEAAIHAIGLPKEHCYMVGDRLETDIKMANDVGMHSVLVMTGVTTADMLAESEHQPTYTLSSISEILKVL